jgi:hypothetical protein
MCMQDLSCAGLDIADYSVDNTDKSCLGVRLQPESNVGGKQSRPLSRRRACNSAGMPACLEADDLLSGSLRVNRQEMKLFVNDRECWLQLGG